MSNVKILLFCGLMLLASLGVGAVAARAVMVPEPTVEAADIPQPVQSFQESIPVGSGLGVVSVTTLVEYFIGHPPHSGNGSDSDSALPVQHFGGC